jgi:hypothetical protein
MKKLIILALGLGIALGSVSFAQDKPADTTTTTPKPKKAKKAKKAKKTADTPAPADKKM